MQQQDLKWTPFLILFYREILRFSKVLAQTIIIPIITSFIYLLIFGVSLGKNIYVLNGISYLAFLIPGLVMMGCMNNSYQNSSSSILSMKFGGEVLDIKASPLNVQQIIWALSFGGICRGLLVGGVILLSGELFYYFHEGSWLIPAHPFHFIIFCLIGGLAFSKLGISVAFWAKSFDHLSAIGGFIITPLIYLGGVFFSLDTLHPFWAKISYLNPLLYFINGVRYGFLSASDVPVWIAFWISLFGLFLFHIIAIWTLKTVRYQRW